MNNKVIFMYDFDGTLCPGYMQDYGLAQDLGFDSARDLFKACDSMVSADTDSWHSFLHGVICIGRERGKNITREYLNSFGKNIKYFDGVEEWFTKTINLGKKYGLKVEHYLISSGSKEILESTKVAKFFKKIYATSYNFDKDGNAFWPERIVDYTGKTQYVYRIRKGAFDFGCDRVNEKMKEEEMIPFSNMIYFGDGDTDVPCFSVIKGYGGRSICVYDPNNESNKLVGEGLFKNDRVNCYLPADYREGSRLFEYIEDALKSLKQE